MAENERNYIYTDTFKDIPGYRPGDYPQTPEELMYSETIVWIQEHGREIDKNLIADIDKLFATYTSVLTKWLKTTNQGSINNRGLPEAGAIIGHKMILEFQEDQSLDIDHLKRATICVACITDSLINMQRDPNVDPHLRNHLNSGENNSLMVSRSEMEKYISGFEEGERRTKQKAIEAIKSL